MTISFVRAGALVFALASMAAVGLAQTRITGTVMDTAGAVVVGANVSVRNVDTEIVSAAETNHSGVYTVNLPNPGRYELSCELAGFKRYTRSGLVLETGRAATVDVRLELGQLTESVTVTGSAPLLDAESGALGQVIDNNYVLNMPIQSRRSTALIRLLGNVAIRADEGAQGYPKFSMAGGRSGNQRWNLDGGPIENMTLGITVITINPPSESLQEFKAMANNYSAEHGHSGGGVIVMATRSGTNELHGALYEWLRNDKLNARTFFAPSRPPLRYNIFGGSLGGPIRKNKTFFFYNYEGGRRRTGVTITRNVPQPAEVNGDFSARADIRVLDPATRVGNTAAQPFPGNVVPQNRMDPVGRAFAQLYPAPNVGANDPRRAPSNNFVANTSDRLSTDYHTLRIDHTLNSGNTIFGRLSYSGAPEAQAAAIAEAAADERAAAQENRHWNTIGGWQRNLRPALINDLRFMYGRRMFSNDGASSGSGLNGKLGLRGVDPDRLARVNVTGHASLAQSANLRRVQDPIQTRQLTDTILWVKGNHSLKTGFDFRYSSNGDVSDQAMGIFGFTDRATNSGLAALLLGWTNNASYVLTDQITGRSNYYALFIQDDWKVTPRLTLNLGLRWEMDTPRFEKDNRQSGFDAGSINPVSGTPGVVTFSGRNGASKYAFDFDKNNFGPRVGFAWRARPTFVIRGGYGVSYYQPYATAVSLSLYQGFSLDATFESADGGFTPAFRFRDGMPAVTRPELGPGLGAVPVGDPVKAAPDFIERRQPNGYSQQWNLTLQKEIPGGVLLESAYLANVGHKLAGGNISINQIPLVNGRGPARADQRLRPFPQFSNVTRLAPGWGDSTYHALNLKFEKRYAAGFMFLGNYSWAKMIDNVKSNNELGDAAGYQHIDARALDKALSSSDIRHRVTFSSLYELPFGTRRRWAISNGVLDRLFGGWGLSGILEARTGPPYGVTEQTNRLNAFSVSQRPNLIRDPALPADRPRSEKINQYFDTSAFVAPGDGNLGNAGGTVGFNPGLLAIDLSLQKLFAITERMNLALRADAVNVPNVPAFAPANLRRGAGNFGTINSVLGASSGREIQLSLRLAW